MSNNQLPADVQERIKHDANDAARGIGDPKRLDATYYGYIAGATAEAERAQKERETWQVLHKGYNKTLEDREAKANKLADAVAQYLNAPKGEYAHYRWKLQNALQQWKDIKDAEPTKEIEYMPIHPDDATKFDCPNQFPMHLLNEDQAQSNHGQSLKRLKERGGLSVKEILAIVHRRKWSSYRDLQWTEALAMLNDILTNPTK